MLKKILFATCVGILLLSQNVQAGEAAQNGAWGGAIGGAILGQVIGRNTRSTLVGTAIGGMLGYMSGSEREMQHDQPVRVYSAQPRMVVSEYVSEERVYMDSGYGNNVVVYHESAPVVRQTVIIDRGRDDRRWSRHREHHWGQRHRVEYSGRYRDNDSIRFFFR
ncbi:MAG TPA: hypothetical protein DEQ20_11415 [Desulfobulbaceae bacterium]|nr:hypothetical protein [Desulfobulbaceae bacterium]